MINDCFKILNEGIKSKEKITYNEQNSSKHKRIDCYLIVT